MGLNLGIADVDGLAWRLVAVLRGWADPGVLAGYDPERRSIATRTAAWSRANLNTISGIVGAAARGGVDEVIGAEGREALAGYVDHPGLALGPLLPPYEGEPRRLVADGRPGSRAPHAPLAMPGVPERSTLDFYGDGPVLLVDAAHTGAAAWLRDGVPDGIPVRRVELSDPGWAAQHGIGRDGAVLVRPDGYVQWRTDVLDDASAIVLSDQLRRLACRP
jgi:hypothetical protein